MQVGGAIGLAVLATLATERTDAPARRRRVARDAALNSGYHLAYLIGAALVAVAIVVALTVLRSEAPAGAEAEADAEAGRGRPQPAYSRTRVAGPGLGASRAVRR